MASMVMMQPASSSSCSNLGMAVISLDFSSTLVWPSAKPGRAGHPHATYHGQPDQPVGSDLPGPEFSIRPGRLWRMPAARPCIASSKGKGRSVTLHPQEALLQQARAFQQSEDFAEYQPAAGGRASPGSAGTCPPISLLWSLPRPSISATPGSHGGQPDPGGYQRG